MLRRSNWTEEGISDHLVSILLDEKKGGHEQQGKKSFATTIPTSLYVDTVAAFLHFDQPLPNMLYVVGGRSQDKGPLDTVEMFDTWHGKWTTDAPPMSTRRAGCAATALPDGRLCVVGGYDENGIVKGVLTSCECFDPDKQVWSPMTGLRRARWGHGCVALRGKIYVIGGCSLRPGAAPSEASMETLRSCEAYDPIRDIWEPIEDLQIARAGFRVVSLGGRYLAAVGGCDDVFGRAEMLPTVELYDTVTKKWSLLDMRLRTPRTTAAVVALDPKTIMVVGGAPGLNSAEIYSVEEPDPNQKKDKDPRTTPENTVGHEGPAAQLIGADSTAPQDESAFAHPFGDLLPRNAAGAPTERNGDDQLCRQNNGFGGGRVGSGSPSSSGSSSTAGMTGPNISTIREIADITEGRMGCQAVTLWLPKAAVGAGPGGCASTPPLQDVRASGDCGWPGLFHQAPEHQPTTQDSSPPVLSYPVCTSRCVVVVGGENGDEERDEPGNDDNPMPRPMRQFSSALVFDTEAGDWRDERLMPPMPTPRTAMAVCVAPGRVRGFAR